MEKIETTQNEAQPEVLQPCLQETRDEDQDSAEIERGTNMDPRDTLELAQYAVVELEIIGWRFFFDEDGSLNFEGTLRKVAG